MHFTEVARVSAALILILAGILKLREPAALTDSLRRVFPPISTRPRLVERAVPVISVGEIVLGGLLLAPLWANLTNFLFCALAASFLTYSVIAYRKGISCGCFGRERHARAVGPIELVRNSTLLAMGIFVTAEGGSEWPSAIDLLAGLLLAAVLGVASVLVTGTPKAPLSLATDSGPSNAPAKMDRRSVLTALGSGTLGIAFGTVALPRAATAATLPGIAADAAKNVKITPLADPRILSGLVGAFLSSPAAQKALTEYSSSPDMSTVRAYHCAVDRPKVGGSYGALLFDLSEGGIGFWSPDLAIDGTSVGFLARPTDVAAGGYPVWTESESLRAPRSTGDVNECVSCLTSGAGAIDGTVLSAVSCVLCLVPPISVVACSLCAGGLAVSALSDVSLATGCTGTECGFGAGYGACVGVHASVCEAYQVEDSQCGSCQMTCVGVCSDEIQCAGGGCSGVFGECMCYAVRDIGDTVYDSCCFTGCCNPNDFQLAAASPDLLAGIRTYSDQVAAKVRSVLIP